MIWIVLLLFVWTVVCSFCGNPISDKRPWSRASICNVPILSFHRKFRDPFLLFYIFKEIMESSKYTQQLAVDFRCLDSFGQLALE